MIAAFLPPYPFRGLPAPYLWVFYRLVHSIGEPMAFLLSSDYLETPASLEARGLPELDLARQRALGYVTPDAESIERHSYRLMDKGLMAALLPRYGGNPLAFFRAFLEEEIAELREEIEAPLRSLPVVPEVILSWTNCPSLSAAAQACGIRVAHLEMGPLREPLYRSTAYFDFCGVNGKTEAGARYAMLDQDELPHDLTLEEVRRSMCLHDVVPDRSQQHSGVGVVFQVEDDSNLLCFGNGFDNTALLARALYEVGSGDILVRTHPGSRFELTDQAVAIDTSPNSAAFVQRCARVLTINSSVGLEALLFDVPVEAFGDSSYAFIVDATDGRERLKRLMFYLFGYLVPFDEVFDADYIRFRLGNPSEQEIMARHVQHHARSPAPMINGSDAVRSFVRDSGLVSTLVQQHRRTSAAQHAVSKLYYRAEGEAFSEERVIACVAAREGEGRLARFRLPTGVRPVALRFDPASVGGTYVFTSSSWGFVGADEVLSPNRPLARLSDLGRRVIGCGERLFSEFGDVPITVLASGDDPFLELAVGDLFADVEAGGTRSGAFEVGFHTSDGQRESIFGIADLRDRLNRLGDRLGCIGIHDVSGLMASIEQVLAWIDGSSSPNEPAWQDMKNDLLTVLSSLRRPLQTAMNAPDKSGAEGEMTK